MLRCASRALINPLGRPNPERSLPLAGAHQGGALSQSPGLERFSSNGTRIGDGSA